MIRPVNLLVTPRIFIERVEIDVTPHLEQKTASISLRAHIRNTTDENQTMALNASILLEGSSLAQDVASAERKLTSGSSTNCGVAPLSY